MKTSFEGEDRGFHGGKKIKGRSRQVAVDTQGNLWAVHVHAANGSDTIEGCVLADLALSELPGVQAFCADQGYRGSFVEYLESEWRRPVHITSRLSQHFVLEPKRWVVERTFAWFNGQRRLSKDYEKRTQSSEAMLYLAAISRSLKSPLF